MITFEQFVQEMPLPKAWKKKVFDLPGDYDVRNFRDALVYAKNHSEYVARGSSRAVFKIKYQGRPTILKIAMNKAGLAQNEEDVKIIFGARTKNNPVVIPGIDYDKKNNDIFWIHQEFAQPLHDDNSGNDYKEFARKVGFPLSTVVYAVRGETGGPVNHTPLVKNIKKIVDEIGDEKFLNDLDVIENWGLYKNRYVVIDFGFSSDVAAEFYSWGRSGPEPPRGINWHKKDPKPKAPVKKQPMRRPVR